MPGQVKLPVVDVVHLPLPLKEAQGAFHPQAGRALKILAAAGNFKHFPGGAAAPVPVAEGVHQPVDALLLNAVILPPGDEIPGVQGGVVLLENVGQHPAAVQPLPPEHVVGEGLGLRILPQQLLRGEVWYLALAQDLRQRGAEAEGVRHPGHAAVRAQVLPEPTFPPDDLPDQALAGGNVGVRLDPHGALGQERTLRRLVHHPPEYLGVQRAQILDDGRLAHEEAVLRVLLHQRQLVAVGAGRLAHGFLHRPQPGHVQVGLAEHSVLRRGGAVAALEQGLQMPPCRLGHAAGHVDQGQLEVRLQGEALQPLGDLHGPQALLRQAPDQAVQRLIIHGRLEHRLVPHAQAGDPDGLLMLRRLGHGDLVGGRGACALHAGAVARVALRENVKDLPGPGAAGQGDVPVLLVDGPGLPAVDPHQHFLAHAQGQRQPQPGKLRGHLRPGAEPAVLPFPAPARALGRRLKRPLRSLRQGQMIHGGEKTDLQGETARDVALLQLLAPDAQPILPLPADIHGHVPRSVIFCLMPDTRSGTAWPAPDRRAWA